MGKHLDRALLLFEQSRHELAEQELRQELAEDPDNASAHAVLGLCLCEREKYKEATEEAKQAITLAPDLPFPHYALAKVLSARNRHEEAAKAIAEAIRLDPEDADYYALLAAIRYEQEQWSAALHVAEEGLKVNAEHVGCTNLRAMALVKLGRREEAGATIDTALARDPENAFSHANMGWTLLHAGDSHKALEHFREALRLDPELDFARAGIVEALKARNIIYALMLRYFLWMARLSGGARWGIIIGGYIGYRILGNVADENPGLAPLIWPFLILYIVFALMTWISSPLFNLLLRLNRFGRLALSRDQVVASNWLGTGILLALLSLVAWVGTGFDIFLYAALVFGLLLIPLAGTFSCHAGWPRNVMALATALLAAAGLGAILLAVLRVPAAGPLFTLFFPGVLIASILANVLASSRPEL